MLLVILIEVIIGIFFIPFHMITLIAKVLLRVERWLVLCIRNGIVIKDMFIKGKKISKGIVSLLNLGAMAYSVFVLIEPRLNKK